MLDYKDIITKHYALGMSGTKIAGSLKVSKSGVNDFLKAFRECPVLSYPLPEGITNYGIAELVYLEASGMDTKLAIMMCLSGLDREAAEERLEKCNGFLSAALKI